jgi:hypothetical protein
MKENVRMRDARQEMQTRELSVIWIFKARGAEDIY